MNSRWPNGCHKGFVIGTIDPCCVGVWILAFVAHIRCVFMGGGTSAVIFSDIDFVRSISVGPRGLTGPDCSPTSSEYSWACCRWMGLGDRCYPVRVGRHPTAYISVCTNANFKNGACRCVSMGNWIILVLPLGGAVSVSAVGFPRMALYFDAPRAELALA